MFELSILSMIPMRPFRCEDRDLRFYPLAPATDVSQPESEPSR